jgi:hypothetical protein
MQFLHNSALYVYTKAYDLWCAMWPEGTKDHEENETEYVVVPKPRERATPLTRVKKMVIAKPLRDMVWTFFVGQEFATLCPCCGLQKIDALHFECGHVEAEAAGGATHLYNLRPICRSCNGSMGKQHMYQFMKKCGFQMTLLQPMNVKAQGLLSDSRLDVTGTRPDVLRSKGRRKD